MHGCFLPPLLGIESFTIEKQFFNDTFLREEQYRKLPQNEKESFKSAFKQTHVLELFGACGYMCSNITLNDKHYKLFHWSGFYAAKWAYRFAKNVDKINKITILPGDGDTTYRKIRCPPVLHQHLVKSFGGDKESDVDKMFIRQSGHLFIGDQELCLKLEDARHFFPFKNLSYNKEIINNLFSMYDDAVHENLDWQSLDLQLTRKAKINVSLLYTWIRKNYAQGTIAIGRLQ